MGACHGRQTPPPQPDGPLLVSNEDSGPQKVSPEEASRRALALLNEYNNSFEKGNMTELQFHRNLANLVMKLEIVPATEKAEEEPPIKGPDPTTSAWLRGFSRKDPHDADSPAFFFSFHKRGVSRKRSSDFGENGNTAPNRLRAEEKGTHSRRNSKDMLQRMASSTDLHSARNKAKGKSSQEKRGSADPPVSPQRTPTVSPPQSTSAILPAFNLGSGPTPVVRSSSSSISSSGNTPPRSLHQGLNSSPLLTRSISVPTPSIISLASIGSTVKTSTTSPTLRSDQVPATLPSSATSCLSITLPEPSREPKGPTIVSVLPSPSLLPIRDSLNGLAFQPISVFSPPPSPIVFPSVISLDDLDSWDFDLFAYQPEALMGAVIKMLDMFGLVEHFEISRIQLGCFIRTVALNYFNNDYHNFQHAVDVLHCCFLFVRRTQLNRKAQLTPLNLLGLLIAALGHDVCHPGTNNQFQIDSKSELSALYNDCSVLENHHCSVLFRLLKTPGCEIFNSLSGPHQAEVRKSIVGCILATDMSQHFEMVGKLDDLLKKVERHSTWRDLNTWRIKSEAKLPPNSDVTLYRIGAPEKQQVLNVLLHAADISNPTKEWPLCRRWAEAMSMEYKKQGQLEQAAGLPISKLMDGKPEHLAQMGCDFIDFIVSPLVLILAGAFDELAICAYHLTRNRAKWNTMLLQATQASSLANQAKKERKRKIRVNLQQFNSSFVDKVQQPLSLVSLTRSTSFQQPRRTVRPERKATEKKTERSEKASMM